MENNDRQQEGGNLGEVREDVFVDPFVGEAVSEDAGQGDWGGGLLDWDLPQEEQQGFVEGEYDPGSEYDPGFVPEGEYTPGSEYDPGFIPEDKRNEESVDTPAADPWGGTQPPEYTGQAGADAGDGEIQMPPEYVGQAGADAGDAEIEMRPEDIGWDTPPLQTVGQAGADAGEGEIEMPPMYAGRADAAVDGNDIEMLSDDAGEADADAGDGEMEEIEFTPEEAAAIPAQADAGDGEIEMPPDYVGQPGSNPLEDLKDVPGVVGNAARAVLRDAAHEKELADYSSYEELAAYYKEIFNGLPDNYRIPGHVDHMNKLDLKSREPLDTYEELKAATKGLLEKRDLQDDVEQRLEARYANEFEDHGFGRYLGADLNYRQLADYYENLHKVLYDGAAPDMEVTGPHSLCHSR
jgi:hypothetical protein